MVSVMTDNSMTRVRVSNTDMGVSNTDMGVSKTAMGVSNTDGGVSNTPNTRVCVSNTVVAPCGRSPREEERRMVSRDREVRVFNTDEVCPTLVKCVHYW